MRFLVWKLFRLAFTIYIYILSFVVCALILMVCGFICVSSPQARQLEEREKELKKQDAFYKEQLAKLKERVWPILFLLHYP